jgi:hypothetical protein
MLHATALASFNEGVRRHEKVLLDQARAARYNVYLLAHTATAGAPTPREKAAAAADALNEDQPHALVTLDEGLKGMIEVLAPFRALARIKRFLRRACRKPSDMPIRTYVSHFLRVNEEELGLLPPFKANNKIELSEMMEIWQYAIPASWNKKLQEQGKDPVLMTTAEFIEATEHIEGAEGDYEKVSQRTDKSSKKKKLQKKESSGTKYCKLHGTNTTHDTKDCKVLKARDSGGYNKGKDSSKYKNKTWSRDGAKSAEKSKKDFHAFVNKAVKQQLKNLDTGKKRDLNALEKNEDGEVSDDDISLSNFDYSTIANMDLGSDSGSNKDYDTADEN